MTMTALADGEFEVFSVADYGGFSVRVASLVIPDPVFGKSTSGGTNLTLNPIRNRLAEYPIPKIVKILNIFTPTMKFYDSNTQGDTVGENEKVIYNQAMGILTVAISTVSSNTTSWNPTMSSDDVATYWIQLEATQSSGYSLFYSGTIVSVMVVATSPMAGTGAAGTAGRESTTAAAVSSQLLSSPSTVSVCAIGLTVASHPGGG